MHCAYTSTHSTIKEEELEEEEILTWITPIKRFLEVGEVHDEEVEAKMIRRVTPNYVEVKTIKRVTPNYLIIDGILYKKGYSTTYIRCVASLDSDRIVRELHEGYVACRDRARSMVIKAGRQGYYWPTMLKHATILLHACESFQKYFL